MRISNYLFLYISFFFFNLIEARELEHIVGGTTANPSQFPHQISLRRTSQVHFCAGTILTPEWVISAAHCMIDEDNIIKPNSVLVVADNVLKSTYLARTWSNVKDIIIHPNFVNDNLTNDVALLQLETPLIFGHLTQAIRISPNSINPNTLCQVSGWGSQEYNVTIVSSYLLYIDIPVMDKEMCQKLLKNYTISKGSFCAGYLEGGKDTCQGDSGGGLICNGFLAGIVSGGKGCAKPGQPGIYSNATYFLPWIKQYVNLTTN